MDIAEILYKANLKRFVIYLGKLIFMSTRLSKKYKWNKCQNRRKPSSAFQHLT